MPAKNGAIQSRLSNLTEYLSVATASLKVLSDATDTPFLKAVSNISESLVVAVQALYLKLFSFLSS
jgi:hypothetical protein